MTEEVLTIALRVSDSESDRPEDQEDTDREDRPEQYSGRHRGIDRLRQFGHVGIVIGAVALLLIVGGGVMWWLIDPNDGTPDVVAAEIGDVCSAAVDEERFQTWVPTEEPLVEPTTTSGEDSEGFDCMYSAESENEEIWRKLTVFSAVEVFPRSDKAQRAYSGLKEIEAAEGRETTELSGGKHRDEVVLSHTEDDAQQHWRWIALSGNATVSIHVTLSGMEPEDDSGEDLSAAVGKEIISALPRDNG